MTNEAIYRLSSLLDQFCEGLKYCGVLQLVRAFPGVCASLFTYTGMVCSDDVLEAIYVDEHETAMEVDDTLVLSFLQRFIRDADESGIYTKASMSEPHTSDFNAPFSILYMLYVVAYVVSNIAISIISFRIVYIHDACALLITHCTIIILLHHSIWLNSACVPTFV